MCQGVFELDDNWQQIINITHTKIPDIHAIICYGSRIINTARPDSDYDIIIIADGEWDMKKRLGLSRYVSEGSEFKINVMIINPGEFGKGMRMAPHLHIAWEMGVVVGDPASLGELMPLAKLGADNELGNIRIQLDDDCNGLRTALRMAWYLRHLLKNDLPLDQISAMKRKIKYWNSKKLVRTIQDEITSLTTVIEKMEKNESDVQLEAGFKAKVATLKR